MKKNFISFIFALGLVAAGGYLKQNTNSTAALNSNAPAGAVEYLESEGGEEWIALFPDRFEMQTSGAFGQHASIKLSEISSVKKIGYKVTINTTRGQIGFDLMGLGGVLGARRFVDKLEELRKNNR